MCACFYCTKNGLFDSAIGIFNDAQILFDEIGWKKRQAHRMQTKLPLENLTQTVWTWKRYEQSYNVAKCLYFFCFFIWILRRFQKNQTIMVEPIRLLHKFQTQYACFCVSIHFSLLLLFFFQFNLFFFFHSENIAKFEQFSLA